MSATLAHEIKNPMTGISTFVQLFESQHKESDYIERFKKTMPSQVQRINQTLQKLLHFAKNPQMTVQKVEVVQLIRSQIEFLKQPRIQLTYQGPDQLFIKTDPNLLQEIIVNLTLNAIEAKADQIYFVVKADQNEWQFEMKDNGPGISKSLQKKIFQPFFSTKTYGTGLGLATVQKNIQALGGKLELFSQSGKGSTFVLTLPYSASSIP
jgi:signal transduction histidine kinase